MRFLRAAAAAALFAVSAQAQTPPAALAQLGPEGAEIVDAGGTVVLTVPLSQAVPWRVAASDGPPRIIVGFGDLVWSELPGIASQSVAEVQVSKPEAGWSDLSLLLREPLSVASAEMATAEDGTALLEVRMLPTTAEEFRRNAQPSDSKEIFGSREASERRLVVAIDPGHGGIDPGAVAVDLIEADLVLAAARRLKEVLLRTGRFDVVLTREEDAFVSLEARLTTARSAGADVFLSLHADALEDVDGSASGITVYRLPNEAAETADELLATRHAPDDLLKGVDLTGAGDDVALALLHIARRDTSPRSHALQRMLIEAFRSSGLQVNSRPERVGAFSVLKSAEIPSVLIELGFLSSDKDRERLAKAGWQDEAAMAVSEALLRWQDEDRLRAEVIDE
ncbi:N-acetylmuramoyl-L-alanine amidase family protein [Silicimonas sp. MF1-12-2]|uniref:N-acetylmuramoyl-L-alanine amidase family protein n=1 Tax=Silicimonas sp. MF1-12-2 TaxID=3384793 RepID=UPI0039B60B40